MFFSIMGEMKANISHISDSSLAQMCTSGRVQAGFPTSIYDSGENTPLSLDSLLVENPPSTFFVRVEGDSMKGCGILPGSLLVVDKSLEVASGDVVVVFMDGEATVKRFIKKDGCVHLKPENDDYPPIKIGDDQEVVIWGIVTSCITQFNKRT